MTDELSGKPPAPPDTTGQAAPLGQATQTGQPTLSVQPSQSSATAPMFGARVRAEQKADAPLWQWLAVGLGGTLVALFAARMARTMNDASPPPFTDSNAITVPSGAVGNAATMPKPPSLPSSLFTVNAFPIGNGPPGAGAGAGIGGSLIGAGRDPWAAMAHADAGSTVVPVGRARPGATPVVPKGKNSYPTEGEAIDATRAALDVKDAAKATAILDQYDKDYGNGFLAPDARALRIEALALKQDDARALALADEFLQDYPHSPRADRIRAIVSQLHARSGK